MEEGDGHAGFAEAVRAWRQRRGWTQEDLSEASGLSTRAIRSLERGRTKSPRRTTVQMLADALEMPRARLLATVRRTAGTEADAEPVPEAESGGGTVPRELPPDLADAGLDARHVVAALVADPTAPYRGVVVTVDAPRASELAVRAAHHAAAKFPDGQLYADLAGTPATPPAVVLRRFLRSLATPRRTAEDEPFATGELAAALRSDSRLLLSLAEAGRSPFASDKGDAALRDDARLLRGLAEPRRPAGDSSFATDQREAALRSDAMFLRSLAEPRRPADDSPFATDELAAAFRSALAGRRMLVVLVGVRSEAQIRPLIPADSRCALLAAFAAE